MLTVKKYKPSRVTLAFDKLPVTSRKAIAAGEETPSKRYVAIRRCPSAASGKTNTSTPRERAHDDLGGGRKTRRRLYRSMSGTF